MFVKDYFKLRPEVRSRINCIKVLFGMSRYIIAEVLSTLLWVWFDVSYFVSYCCPVYSHTYVHTYICVCVHADAKI